MCEVALFCFCPAVRPGHRSTCWTAGRKINGVPLTAEGQLTGRRDEQEAFTSLLLCFTFYLLQSPSLSHCSHIHVFNLHFSFFSLFAQRVKGWLGATLETYNLEETWDPFTDTNTRSPHPALSPPASHMLVTVAGLCLPGTRHPACLSHSGWDPIHRSMEKWAR